MTRIEDGTAENGETFFVYEIKKENNSKEKHECLAKAKFHGR